MESQPEDEEHEQEEVPVRVPAYHKKANGAATTKGILTNKKPMKEAFKEDERECSKASEDSVAAENRSISFEDKPVLPGNDEHIMTDR